MSRSNSPISSGVIDDSLGARIGIDCIANAGDVTQHEERAHEQDWKPGPAASSHEDLTLRQEIERRLGLAIDRSGAISDDGVKEVPGERMGSDD